MNETNAEEDAGVNAGENSQENNEENGSESEHPVNSPVTFEEYLAALDIGLRNFYMMMNMQMQFLYMSDQYYQTLLANQPQDMNTPSDLNIPPSNITSGHTQAQTTPDMAARPRRPEGAILYIIPGLWKRLAAELIDFFILFGFRFLLFFFYTEILEISGLNEFLIAKYNKPLDYYAAMRTSEIILLEIIHRIIVFIYEGYYLQEQADIRHMGGATPGKIFMSLRVVKCDQVIPVEPEPYLECWVKPGTNLDCKYSFARSFIKNILIVVLFPLWFVYLLFEYKRTGYRLFQYKRTGYDVICHTMVVEVVDDE